MIREKDRIHFVIYPCRKTRGRLGRSALLMVIDTVADQTYADDSAVFMGKTIVDVIVIIVSSIFI